MPGVPADQNSSNAGAQSISDIWHIENWIVCCIDTYFIPI